MQVTQPLEANHTKKASLSQSKGRTKGRKPRNPTVNTEAVNILRTVGDQEAFHFYEAVGKPIGEVAKNLTDFLDKVKSVKAESVVFHLERRDFQNWIDKTLGDSKLAEELGEISSSNNDDVRTNICKTVENRIKELKEPSITQMKDENSTILLPSSFLSVN
jgi:predicted lactoylglutathione lyase